MFKAQYSVDGVLYSCERVYKKDNKTGLRYLCGDECIGEYGFDIEAQDPRMFELNGKVYVVFIGISPYSDQNWCVGITPFDSWNPVFLQVENMEPKNNIEKNWAPFVKDGALFFVYNYDPLVIVTCDVNNGICKIVYKQDCHLPIDTSRTYLRGGSNLIPYGDDCRYFIGGCHSRISKQCFEHYTHIVLLDTVFWKLVYVSKPVMYLYEPCDKVFNSWWVSLKPSTKRLDTLHNILMDKTPNIIQDPVSLYSVDGKYYITVNVRDSVSLLYEISFANLLDFVGVHTGNYDQLVKEMIL
jgi:hypothetical protein